MAKFEIKQQAVAGTVESSDIQIIIEENPGKGIDIQLQSSVENQYGRQIRKVITETLGKLHITDATLKVVDQGALDCTIIARTVAVVHRASGITENYNWEEMEQWNA